MIALLDLRKQAAAAERGRADQAKDCDVVTGWDIAGQSTVIRPLAPRRDFRKKWQLLGGIVTLPETALVKERKVDPNLPGWRVSPNFLKSERIAHHMGARHDKAACFQAACAEEASRPRKDSDDRFFRMRRRMPLHHRL